MYNAEKRRQIEFPKVKDIINNLETQNPDAVFLLCGDNYPVYIHVEQDDSVVSVDNCSLSDMEEYDNVDIVIPIQPVQFHVKKDRLENLLYNSLDLLSKYYTFNEICSEDKGIGITKEELSYLGFKEE